MTGLLKIIFERAHALPEEKQNQFAQLMLASLDEIEEPEDIPPEDLEAILEGIAELERGEFVSEEEMNEVFKRFGA